MQLGIHVVRRAALPELAGRGVIVPEPWLGILDLARTIEGLGPEPASDQALGVVGLDALLAAVGRGDGAEDQIAAVLQALRGHLREARRYFEWRHIPLCFLVDGRLLATVVDDRGPELEVGDRRHSLTALFGQGLRPMLETQSDKQSGKQSGKIDWWWTPQPG